MKPRVYPLSRCRTLVIATVDQLGAGLEERAGRPIVTLLTDNIGGGKLNELAAIVVRLLAVDCDYFVCFGRNSERLHDEVDALAEREAGESKCAVVTTWHVDETPDDVAEFFINVAGARDTSLLVGIVGAEDGELQTALMQLASRTEEEDDTDRI